jgi:predicted  nucleic acid-binding Zn-ribbon protein
MDDARLAQLNARFDEIQQLMVALESRVAGVDSRVTGIEKFQKVVLTEVRSLATKVDRLTRTRGRPNAIGA